MNGLILNDKFKLLITPMSASIPGQGKFVIDKSDLSIEPSSSNLSLSGDPVITAIKQPSGGLHGAINCTAVGPLLSDTENGNNFSDIMGNSEKITTDNSPVLLDNMAPVMCSCQGMYTLNGSKAPFKGSCQIKVLDAGQIKAKGL
ncbi:hypothetical protein [Aureibacter tunicatorum]|uniref:Uncharacterized protein n=1 Tax=Aureibacter tunicatorum TaxID=866807 RepID=A0AAE3XSV9_9BACT|nr:hypothetical protein [Aureibacter tunicatorum]MDR6241972.1 hypothetical protein [Aureibacter tunicatorum]BDD07525.1 hypothetical protein AUTU_50080 [Aureibacter tunicatorum]